MVDPKRKVDREGRGVKNYLFSADAYITFLLCFWLLYTK